MEKDNVSIDEFVRAFEEVGEKMNLPNFEVKKGILEGDSVIFANYENGKLVEIQFFPDKKKSYAYARKYDKDYFSLMQNVADITKTGPFGNGFIQEKPNNY
ncbi:hypothetical protein C0585_01700 [Candidatus Woesearchaeota archaeon]|nr:MAG: hypothetical protein C0585_01700 [Candidatus Woesearchaeota archaeon]